MVIAPTNRSMKVYPFVDREDCKQVFKSFLENSEQSDYNILHYYGISGIGKSKLQQELQTITAEEYKYIIWANVDFKVKSHREIGTCLFSLRNQLAGKYKVEFNHFDIAHSVHWKKVNPEFALSKENYSAIEEDGFVDIVLQVLDQFGPFNLIVNVFSYITHFPKKIQKWFQMEHTFMNQLNEADPNEIEQLLPLFFISDLKAHLEKKSKKAVFFIDTYEALWEESRNIGNFNAKDEWIRNIIAEFEDVAWIFCGREKLRWNEVDADWGNYLNQHKVGVLPEKYCIEFLELSDIAEKDIQNTIIESSEGYPYYLALSVDTYFAIKQKRMEPTSDDFSKTCHEIFNRFFYYLNEAERSTLLILSCANFWDPNLMNMLIEEFGTNYPKSKSAFDELHRFSFMEDLQNRTWGMHPLMKKSLQDNFKSEEKEKVYNYLFDYYDNQLNAIDIKTIQEKHKTALNEAFFYGKQFTEIEDLFKWFSERKVLFDEAGFWDFLIPLHDDISNNLEKTFGPDHTTVFLIQHNLAELYTRMGKYEKALPLYERSLETLEKELGSEKTSGLPIINNLAELYRSMGMYEKALPLYERSLKAVEKMHGPKHPNVATILSNLAVLYTSIGKYEKALPLCKRSIKILEKTLGSEHPNVALPLNNFGELYRLMGKYEKALPLCKRSVEIMENALGSDHPNVATSINNLALLYTSMGKFEEALPLYKRSIGIMEKTLGSEHPNVALPLSNFAELYRLMGKDEQALPLCKRSVEIIEKAFGPDNPAVATPLNNLASLYTSMGKDKKALPLYERSLEIMEKTLGSEHPSVAAPLSNLALLYTSMGKDKKALPLYERSLEIMEKTLGLEHPNVATPLNNLALLYTSMEKYEKAVPLYERSLEIIEKAVGTDDPTYIEVKNNLDSLPL